MIKDRDFHLSAKIRIGCNCGWAIPTMKWKRNHAGVSLASVIAAAGIKAEKHQERCQRGWPGNTVVDLFAKCRYCNTKIAADTWPELQEVCARHFDSALCIERSLAIAT